jgi:hypothetical protein
MHSLARILVPATLLPALASQQPVAAPLALPVPEIPALWREVTGVIDGVVPSNPQFTRPHIPGLRTTADGRITCVVEGAGGFEGTPRFGLLVPEKMTAPLHASAPGAYTMSSPAFAWLAGYPHPQASAPEFTQNTGPVSHVCIWDDAGPVAVGSDDVYDVKVFVSSNTGGGSQRRTRFFVTPVRIVVQNPKTANAAIASVTRTGPTLAGPQFPYEASAFEPVIVGDGRLLVVRVFAPHLPFNGGTVGADIVYSHYSGGATADPTQWLALLPISHAPFDPAVATQYPFAFRQFRDAEGTPIPDGAEIGGSYPWMDRAAKNLFFEGIKDQLHYFANGTWNNGRHPQQPVPGDAWAAYDPVFQNGSPAPQEDQGLHQGVTYLGLWTQGKMVQIDNLNNDMDYAVGQGDGI